jgi:hypothetical protein
MATKFSNQFYARLNEAISDLVEYGFDSQKRLDEWLQVLEIAARGSLVDPSVLQREVREALTRAYAKAVEGPSPLKVHRGISHFTLAAIKPKLRAELDRRILVSAQLIKLNREASIRRTLQRFAGWATSIPAGGTDVGERQKTAESVRKGIAALPFEERRVVIDQGHKLSAAVNDIIARDGGAIAGKWVHVMERGPGYQPRPEHVKLNDHIFVIRNNWALAAGFMKLAGRQYTDQIEQPGEKIFCRCTYEYLYNLRDLPEDMITAKGRAELIRVRAQIAGWH